MPPAPALAPGELRIIGVADTALTFTWKRPQCAELALQVRVAHGGVAWGDVPRVALGATLQQYEACALRCQETYEARLVWRASAGEAWVEGPIAAFDTLPAGCGPKKAKPGEKCVIA